MNIMNMIMNIVVTMMTITCAQLAGGRLPLEHLLFLVLLQGFAPVIVIVIVIAIVIDIKIIINTMTTLILIYIIMSLFSFAPRTEPQRAQGQSHTFLWGNIPDPLTPSPPT